MNAIIISIGDELVLGQTVDTNSAWLSQQLAAIGISVIAHATVGDDQKAIEREIRASALRCDVLIVSGGIGPTPDDLTRQALAEVLRQPLELNEHWLHFLQDFFKKRGREMPEMNKIQAMIPHGAKIILNSCGTAAGIHAKLGLYTARAMPPIQELQGRVIGRVLVKMGCITRDELVQALTYQKSCGGLLGQILIEKQMISEEDLEIALKAQKGVVGDVRAELCEIFVIPGVPSEMKAMFTRDILPALQKESGGAVILSRTLHTFGLGESAIAQMLGELMDRKRNPTVGTTVANGIVSVRVNSKFDSKEQATRELAETESACRAALGDLIFGADEQTLPQVVGELLKAKKQSVTTAESCTGGLLAKFLTDVPGSSAYFKRGWITYENEAKTELLGVDPSHIKGHGAVSDAVVREMAVGAMGRARADFALAISGIAGPDGGTEEKPVGTVCIGIAFQKAGSAEAVEAHARRFSFPGDREMIRDRSAKMALTMLRFHLIGKALPF
jgi:competence/damage-inducible protein CinA-like protein/molybdenum cofactor synthesis domain-containing protein